MLVAWVPAAVVLVGGDGARDARVVVSMTTSNSHLKFGRTVQDLWKTRACSQGWSRSGRGQRQPPAPFPLPFGQNETASEGLQKARAVCVMNRPEGLATLNIRGLC